jgi:hypothetical protein
MAPSSLRDKGEEYLMVACIALVKVIVRDDDGVVCVPENNWFLTPQKYCNRWKCQPISKKAYQLHTLG